MLKQRLGIGASLLAFSLLGCSSHSPAPITDLSETLSSSSVASSRSRSSDSVPSVPLPNSGYHKVARGETLYAIAWTYGLDHDRLAKINGISPPYTIYPGQRIRLKGSPVSSGNSRKRSLSTQRNEKNSNKNENIASRYKNTQSNEKVIHKKHGLPDAKSGNIQWSWPAGGQVIQGFSAQAKGIGNKGIDIAGRKGDPVRAAADGKVVYSGDGLIGYGNLVIIKHNDTFLSAYAHNHRLLVKEGESVKAGQKIAEIGSSGTDQRKLHFEIRRQGKPVNPMKFLPKRSEA